MCPSFTGSLKRMEASQEPVLDVQHVLMGLTQCSVNAVCYILYQPTEFSLWKKAEVFNGFQVVCMCISEDTVHDQEGRAVDTCMYFKRTLYYMTFFYRLRKTYYLVLQ